MELTILDKDFNAIGIVDSFVSILWADRYDTYGDFELYTVIDPIDTSILELCRIDNYVMFSDSDRVMIIEERSITSDLEDGDKVIIKGRSLESMLINRLVWTQTAITGNVQNGIKKLINENIINPVDPDRKISNFIFEDSTDPDIADATLEYTQFTGTTIHDVLVKLCTERGWGFKIILDEHNRFVFSLYNGIDRSYEQDENSFVIFSPQFDNIINSNYFESKTEFKNVALVAGEGEGLARKRTVVGSGIGTDRRELYVDARDISSTADEGVITTDKYNNLLIKRGNEKLSETKFIKAFEGKVETTQTFIFNEDFFLGDLIQITNEYGVEERSRVSEIIISTNINDGPSIIPTFVVIMKE